MTLASEQRTGTAKGNFCRRSFLLIDNSNEKFTRSDLFFSSIRTESISQRNRRTVRKCPRVKSLRKVRDSAFIAKIFEFFFRSRLIDLSKQNNWTRRSKIRVELLKSNSLIAVPRTFVVIRFVVLVRQLRSAILVELSIQEKNCKRSLGVEVDGHIPVKPRNISGWVVLWCVRVCVCACVRACVCRGRV